MFSLGCRRRLRRTVTVGLVRLRSSIRPAYLLNWHHCRDTRLRGSKNCTCFYATRRFPLL